MFSYVVVRVSLEISRFRNSPKLNLKTTFSHAGIGGSTVGHGGNVPPNFGSYTKIFNFHHWYSHKFIAVPPPPNLYRAPPNLDAYSRLCMQASVIFELITLIFVRNYNALHTFIFKNLRI